MRGGLLGWIAWASIGCGEHGSSPAPIDAPPDRALSSEKEIISFRFAAIDNPNLLEDLPTTIVGTDITATARFPVTLADLTATFTTTGVAVTVAGQPQTSGVTQNSFGAANPVFYTVVAEDGSTRRYAARIGGRGFLQRVDFATGMSPASLAAGDFNGDGKPDLAVTSQTPARLSILLDTTPTGATTPSLVKTDFAILAPGLLAIGDLNGDGKPDVAVASSGSNPTAVFLNTTATGAPTPTFAARVDLAVGTGSHAVAIADVNADGKPDLAVTNGGVDNSVSVLLNLTPTGATMASFAPKVDFATGPAPFSIDAGDLDGDSKPDLVVSHVGGFRPVVALINTTSANAATPTFSAPATILSHESIETVRIADFNADGKPDLVVSDANPIGVLVFLNTTASGTTPPTFATPSLFATGGTPTAFGFSDFDGDGKLDLVAPTSASTLALLLGLTPLGATTPLFRVRREYGTTSLANSVAIGDFNGDIKPDVAVANTTSGSVSVLLAE